MRLEFGVIHFFKMVLGLVLCDVGLMSFLHGFAMSFAFAAWPLASHVIVLVVCLLVVCGLLILAWLCPCFLLHL